MKMSFSNHSSFLKVLQITKITNDIGLKMLLGTWYSIIFIFKKIQCSHNIALGIFLHKIIQKLNINLSNHLPQWKLRNGYDLKWLLIPPYYPLTCAHINGLTYLPHSHSYRLTTNQAYPCATSKKHNPNIAKNLFSSTKVSFQSLTKMLFLP
jgi:hypothetical protein